MVSRPPTATIFDKFNPYHLARYRTSAWVFCSLRVVPTGNAEEPTTAYGLLVDDVPAAPDKLSATFHIKPKAGFHHGRPCWRPTCCIPTPSSPVNSPHPSTARFTPKSMVPTAVSERVVRFDSLTPNPELPLSGAASRCSAGTGAKSMESSQAFRQDRVRSSHRLGTLQYCQPGHGPRHHLCA